MKRFALLTICLLLPLLAACSDGVLSPSPSPTAAPAETPEAAPEVVVFTAETPQPAVEETMTPSPEPQVPQNSVARDNLLADREELKLVSFTGSISLYPDASAEGKPVKLVNQKTLRSVNELIVLETVAPPEGKPLYYVRAAFSGETGYVLVSATNPSKLAQRDIAGFAVLNSSGCSILFEPKATGAVIAKQSGVAARILGAYKEYFYIVTEDGTGGFADPKELTRIDRDALLERLAFQDAPAIASIKNDPLTEPSANNAAKMLRVGENSASVTYWDTAQSHSSSRNRLKKATIAMLNNAVGTGQKPVGHKGIQYLPCLEVPPLTEGEELQQGLDFNLHGSIYTDSPLTGVTAELASLGKSASVRESVTFDPAENVTGYSLENDDLTLEQKALDELFDIRNLRAGRYRFTLSATTAAQPNATTLLTVECKIVDTKRIILTQNKFDDNYYEALKFFGGNTDKFVFHYSLKDTRDIATENDWRNTYLVESSLGRVHRDAVPYFETANHYLENTYVRVLVKSPKTGKTSGGNVTLLKNLIEKSTTYVPRFQSNMAYVSHHTLGTAIDVNDNMYPNFNILTNHELVGGDVKDHLVYNGVKTNGEGIRYYDFTYDGSYTARYEQVPKTVINYLLYELAFFRAGFQWGFYYETACDGMHFMLTENDVNRHMHSDIGLRKIYEYIEPEWTYVPSASPAPVAGDTPVP